MKQILNCSLWPRHDFKTGTTWVMLTLPSSAASTRHSLVASETQLPCADSHETVPRRSHLSGTCFFFMAANFSVVPVSLQWLHFNGYHSLVHQILHTGRPVESLLPCKTSQARSPSSVLFSTFLSSKFYGTVHWDLNTQWFSSPRFPKSFHGPLQETWSGLSHQYTSWHQFLF